MPSKILLAVAAAIALSASAARAEPTASGRCSYDYDVTRAVEPAPAGCATAILEGGGYDAIAEKPLLAVDDESARIADASPARPSALVAMAWMGP